MKRISPLAIWGINLSNEQLFDSVKAEVELSHPNSLAIEISFVYVYLLTLLIKNNGDTNHAKK